LGPVVALKLNRRDVAIKLPPSDRIVEKFECLKVIGQNHVIGSYWIWRSELENFAAVSARGVPWRCTGCVLLTEVFRRIFRVSRGFALPLVDHLLQSAGAFRCL